jgi:hypothetical protein
LVPFAPFQGRAAERRKRPSALGVSSFHCRTAHIPRACNHHSPERLAGDTGTGRVAPHNSTAASSLAASDCLQITVLVFSFTDMTDEEMQRMGGEEPILVCRVCAEVQ